MDLNVSSFVGTIRRKAGIGHHLYDAQVWGLSHLCPPPPVGRFPAPWMASGKPPYNLLVKGGEVTDETLLQAYSQGIFPFYEEEPVAWYSCNPRMVLFLEKMKLKKGLRPLLQSGQYRVTFDSAFEAVVRACSDRKSTWLIPERIKVALSLFHKGIAHSAEAWNQDGQLVGGIFGVDMGTVFISESAFHREDNAGKVACAYLNCHLQHWGYRINDIWGFQEHFRRLGYEEIPRRQYLNLLKESLKVGRTHRCWRPDEGLDVGSWIPSIPGSQVVR